MEITPPKPSRARFGQSGTSVQLRARFRGCSRRRVRFGGESPGGAIGEGWVVAVGPCVGGLCWALWRDGQRRGPGRADPVDRPPERRACQPRRARRRWPCAHQVASSLCRRGPAARRTQVARRRTPGMRPRNGPPRWSADGLRGRRRAPHGPGWERSVTCSKRRPPAGPSIRHIPAVAQVISFATAGERGAARGPAPIRSRDAPTAHRARSARRDVPRRRTRRMTPLDDPRPDPRRERRASDRSSRRGGC